MVKELKAFILLILQCSNLVFASNLDLTHKSEVQWSISGGLGDYNAAATSGFGKLIDDIVGNFTVRYPANTESDFFITITTTSTDQTRFLSGGGRKLKYQIYKSSGKNDYIGSKVNANMENILFDSMSASSSAGYFPLSYYFYIYPGQNVGAGTYQGNANLRLYTGSSNGSYKLSSSEKVTYTVDVNSEAKLNILGVVGGAYTLDFGELESFETKDLDIELVANSKVRLKVSSHNGGLLKNESEEFIQEGDITSIIPYQFYVDGNLFLLKKNYYNTLLEGYEENGIYRKLFSVSIQIGSVEGKKAGTYSDSVYMVVQNVH